MKGVTMVLIMAFVTLMLAVPVSAHTAQEPMVTDLIAGQHYDAGNVSVWNDGQYIYVKLETEGDWCLNESQVNTSQSCFCPIPGKFNYKNESHECANEYTYTIPLSWECQDELKMAVHAVVYNGSTDETAWGEGTKFRDSCCSTGSSWAMYFNYTVQCCLGDCYQDDGCQSDLLAENVTCYDCIAQDGYWKPHPNTHCFCNPETLESLNGLCLDGCPQCVDGTDNDDDDAIDYMGDPDCCGGIDNDEGKECCQPVPELSTFLLVAIGLVGLLVMKRR